jgi:predicted O-methyltransferase YrrM
VEIGTAKGGVFHALCQLASDKATVVSIDMEGGQFGGEGGLPDARTIKSFGKKTQNIHVIRGDSHLEKTKKELTKVLNREIDLLFIDGDHSYKGVKSDWDMYSPLVKKGGHVVFHDICYHPQVLACEVERFWKEIKAKHKILEFIDPNDQIWGGIGVVEI